MNELKTRAIQYNVSDLRAWKDGNYEFLRESQASDFIKKILIQKVMLRRKGRIRRGDQNGDRRFFGEAWVAAHREFVHDAGWYGSFKWLTAPAWCASGASFSRWYQSEFKLALDEHVVNLEEVQSKALTLRRMLQGEKPVPPDLWLVTASQHRFIEVKLPGDTLKDRQLAGLAIIATCLNASRPISVEVVSLSPDYGMGPCLSEWEQTLFNKFCDALRAIPTANHKTQSSATASIRHGSRKIFDMNWHDGHVDRDQEHIEIRYGDASHKQYEELQPIALIGKARRRVFPVRWLVDNFQDPMVSEVRRELDFYLVDKREPDPWGYAIYHCGTSANMYSKVHWSYYPSGEGGERHSSRIVRVSAEGPPGGAADRWNRAAARRRR
jgi:hypothetical protein